MFVHRLLTNISIKSKHFAKTLKRLVDIGRNWYHHDSINIRNKSNTILLGKCAFPWQHFPWRLKSYTLCELNELLENVSLKRYIGGSLMGLILHNYSRCFQENQSVT